MICKPNPVWKIRISLQPAWLTNIAGKRVRYNIVLFYIFMYFFPQQGERQYSSRTSEGLNKIRPCYHPKVCFWTAMTELQNHPAAITTNAVYLNLTFTFEIKGFSTRKVKSFLAQFTDNDYGLPRDKLIHCNCKSEQKKIVDKICVEFY